MSRGNNPTEGSTTNNPTGALTSSPFTPTWTSSLTIPDALLAILRPHQIDALHFVWRKLVDEGLVRMAARSGNCTLNQRLDLYHELYGCILGHSMGLGKSLTAVSFVLLLQAQLWLMTLKRNRASSSGPNTTGAAPRLCRALRVLVLCPFSCLSHWQQTIEEWVRPDLFGRVTLPTYVPSASSTGSVSASMARYNAILESFYTNGGILFMGYEEYTHYVRRLADAATRTAQSGSGRFDRVSSALDAIRARVPTPSTVTHLDMLESADVLVLDEAHRLRSLASVLMQTVTKHLSSTQLRLALTGTPIQNHLEDYNVMQSVVTGRLLDAKKFHRYFVAPIERGQCSDSSFSNFREMQKCIASLRLFFADTVHHCGPELLEAALPPRHEHVFFFDLSPAQEEAYKAMLKQFKARQSERGRSAVMLLTLYHQSSHLCLHPCLVTSDFGVETPPPPPPPPPGAAATALTVGDEKGEMSSENSGDDDGENNGFSVDVGDTWTPPFSIETVDVNLSPKLAFTMALVRHILHDRKEKVVIYSRYISHITLICGLLRRDLGVEPLVLTGACRSAERRHAIETFNSDPARPVMVASVGAGGVGIKLIAANHCILLDVGWNPASDTQTTYRIFRFGQTRSVYVYRLAGFGTCEHVVFAYALQKSWLHRKIADAADPTRHVQHIKENYLIYPCRIPLEDDGVTVSNRGDGHENDAAGEEEMVDLDALLSREERVEKILARCDRGCSPAAAVLRQEPLLQTCVHAVVPHSFLLRDTTDEVISAMSARFADVQQQKTTQASVVVAPVLPPVAPAPRPAQSLLQQCEPALADVAHEAANYCILQVIQHTHLSSSRGDGVEGEEEEEEESSDDETSDSAAIVRSADATLRRTLEPLLPAALPDNLLRAPLHNTTFLAETMLAFYEMGVHAVVKRLDTTSYTKLRTTLASRVPFDGHRHNSGSGSAGHRSIAATLATRPSKIFSALRPAEETYICSELGLCRPFVKQCIVVGLLDCLRSAPSSHGRDADLQAVTQLFDRITPTADEDGIVNSSSRQHDSLSDEHPLSTTTDAHEALLPMPPAARDAAKTLSAFFEGLWPKFVEFRPPLLAIQLRTEKTLTARAFTEARRAPLKGFLSLKEVSAALQLQPYQGRSDQLGCGRCRGAFLRRRSATELVCPLCHYNAEFEAANHTQWYHQVFLYRFSVVTNSLESLSLTKAFTDALDADPAAAVADGEDRTTAAMRQVRLIDHLRQASTHAPSWSFGEKCLSEGIDATLKVLPAALRQLLSLQCGASLDTELFREVLFANAHAVWATSARTHVKAAVAAALHGATGLAPDQPIPGGSSMPSMMMAVGLTVATQTEGVLYAHELLHDSTTRSPRHTLLRFLCDAVVKMLFVRHLQGAHAAERASAAARAANGDARSSASDGTSRATTPSFHSDAESDDADDNDGNPLRVVSPSISSFSNSNETTSSSDDSASARLPMPDSGLRTRSRRGHKRKRTHHTRGRRTVRRRYDLRPSSSSSPSFASSSSSSGSASRSRSRSGSFSSFASCYSKDRESFASISADRTRSDKSDSPHPPHSGATTAKKPLADEAPHAPFHAGRVNAYWMAYCEVYGTQTAEQLPVYVDDGPSGLTLLPAPPSSFWSLHMARMSGEGMLLNAVISTFYELILPLTHVIRVIE